MHDESCRLYLEGLEEPGAISAADTAWFRREMYRDGAIGPQEAAAIFALNDRVALKSTEWNAFFIEALTDYTVQQAEPRGYVSRENAKWLVERISHDGVVDSASELELLVRVLAKADACPPALAGFALAQIAYAVVEGGGPLASGLRLTRGVIGAPEVELLRTVLYAAGGANGLSISRQEAEILFDLNSKTDPARNHPAWQDLFVRAVGNYLMAATGDWHAPSRSEALARREWLDDTEENPVGAVGEVFASFGNLFSEGFFDDIFTSAHVQMERAWKAKNAARSVATEKAEKIDAGEAKWLIDRITRDEALDPNERALLEFVSRQGRNVDPAMVSLLSEVA